MEYQKGKELSQQTVEELQALCEEARAEYFNLQATLRKEGQLSKPHLLKQTRRYIARISTILNQKRRVAG